MAKKQMIFPGFTLAGERAKVQRGIDCILTRMQEAMRAMETSRYHDAYCLLQESNELLPTLVYIADFCDLASSHEAFRERTNANVYKDQDSNGKNEGGHGQDSGQHG